MQDNVEQKKSKEAIKIKELPVEDKQRLVGAFAWLINQAKKQDLALNQKKLSTQ